MSKRDGPDAALERAAGQERMPQFARGHFEGEFMRAGESAHIRPAGHEWQPQASRGSFGQPFVRVAAAAAQLMVEMCDGQLPAKSGRPPRQQMQQDHGIESAGDRDQNSFAAAKQPVLPHGRLHALGQIAHGAILCTLARWGNPFVRAARCKSLAPK